MFTRVIYALPFVWKKCREDRGILEKLLLLFSCNHSASRRKLRVKYNLPEEPINDCCVAWCCGTCGLCQEALEIIEQDTKKSLN
jgi:Cys-rich protein (TIGR01571 family)